MNFAFELYFSDVANPKANSACPSARNSYLGNAVGSQRGTCRAKESYGSMLVSDIKIHILKDYWQEDD